MSLDVIEEIFPSIFANVPLLPRLQMHLSSDSPACREVWELAGSVRVQPHLLPGVLSTTVLLIKLLL